MKNLTILLVCLFLSAAVPTHAQEDPCGLGEAFYYIGEYNGHAYYLSWDCYFAADAAAAAEAAGGHLATISDAGENEFVSVGVGYNWAWIGFSDAGDEGNFTWVNGEPVSYTNWCGGEPNNCCSGEHWTTINWCYNEDGSLGWNDLYDGIAEGDYGYCLWYVLEIDADDDCDGVTNCLDECPGGDDNGPCTGEGWPLDVPATWICSNNNNSEKYMVCHEGNTICVSSNAVATHLAHGDFLGPCTGCEEEAFVAPFNNQPVETGKPILPDFTVYPNPGYGDFKIDISHSDTGTIEIFNQNGQFIRSIDIKAYQPLNINIDEPGMYFIQLITQEQLITKKLFVVR